MEAWNLCHVSWLTKAAYSPWAHQLMLRCYIITDNQRNNHQMPDFNAENIFGHFTSYAPMHTVQGVDSLLWSTAENLRPSSGEWLTAALSSKIRSTQCLTTQPALLTWSQWWHRDVKPLMHLKASVMACANIIAVWSRWREMGSEQCSFTSCLTYVSIGATWCGSRGKHRHQAVPYLAISFHLNLLVWSCKQCQ